MQIHITARHLELTPALSDYVQKKLERVARHFQAVMRAQVVLAVEKHRHIAEVVTHANGHHDFRAKEESVDLYAAVDLVAEKLHKHMARQKDKRVRGRRRDGPVLRKSLAEVSAEPSAEKPDASEPAISLVKRFTPQPMTVSQAAREIEQNDLEFIVFLNNESINVLYKRRDNTYGLLEPNL
jgi:putative sigma-54 modulation protein